MPMATKLGKEETYLKGLLLKKSHVPFIRGPCEITFQTKNVIPPLPNGKWPPSLVGW